MKEVAAFEEGGCKKRRVTLILPNLVTVQSPAAPKLVVGNQAYQKGGDIRTATDINAHAKNTCVKNTPVQPISIGSSDNSDNDDEDTIDENMDIDISDKPDDHNLGDDVLAVHEMNRQLSPVSVKTSSAHL